MGRCISIRVAGLFLGLQVVRKDNPSVRMQSFCLMSGNPVSCDTGETSAALSPFFSKWQGIAFGKCGPKNGSISRTQFWCRFLSWNRNWFRRRTLNRHLQKRFYLSSAAGIRRARMVGSVKSIHDFRKGDACIVAVARLVSLWRNTCNYNVFQGM